MTINGRRRKVGNCKVCDAKKSQFVATTGTGFMNKLINRLPMELHVPGHNFTGRGTRLRKLLLLDGTRRLGQNPLFKLTKYHHDLCYAQHKDATARNTICDEAMLASLNTIPNCTTHERLDCSIVGPIIGTKVRFGLGVKKLFAGPMS